MRGQESEGGTLLFHFETKSGASVFNPDSLRFMKEVDDLVMSVPGYADYCRLEYHPKGGGGCVERMTPVLHFFPTEVTLPNGTVAVVPDGKGPLVKDIDAVVRSFASARRKFGYYLGGDFDEATLVSSITRAKYPMGAPLFGEARSDRLRVARDRTGMARHTRLESHPSRSHDSLSRVDSRRRANYVVSRCVGSSRVSSFRSTSNALRAPTSRVRLRG